MSGETRRALFEGFDARVIQYELDHVDGVLFVDRLSPAKRSILAGKLRRIANGETRPSYPMKLFKNKNKEQSAHCVRRETRHYLTQRTLLP